MRKPVRNMQPVVAGQALWLLDIRRQSVYHAPD